MTPPLLDCARTALFLDLDGTLAPIVERPWEAALPLEALAALRAAVTALAGRVAVLSGRALDDAELMTHGLVRSIAGSHGLDLRLPDGQRRHAATAEALNPVRAGLKNREPGLLVEDKGAAIALHYRERPELAAAAHGLVERLAQEHGLIAMRGKMVAEIRAPGADKGAALEMFMSHPPFAGMVPVHVGDDHTDANAFRAAHALGGYGVLVGEAPVEGALYRLPDPAAVTAWLTQSIAQCA